MRTISEEWFAPLSVVLHASSGLTLYSVGNRRPQRLSVGDKQLNLSFKTVIPEATRVSTSIGKEVVESPVRVCQSICIK